MHIVSQKDLWIAPLALVCSAPSHINATGRNDVWLRLTVGKLFL